MKRKSFTIFIALLIFTTLSALGQKVYEGSNAFTYSENNNHVMKLQQSGGSPLTPGNVKIEFYGHMAFKITSPEGLTVLIDPWRNDPTGTFGVWYSKNFPPIPVDMVLSTHAHFDHDAVHIPHATMCFERLAGNFKLADVEVTGIADKHQCVAPGEVKWDQILRDKLKITNLCPPDNGMSWDNVVYIVKTGGLRIGFWGDNRPDPGPAVVAQLKNLDVLIMNIDGSEHILSYKQINKILARFKPKAVIPGHYLVNGLTAPSSSLKPADEWVDSQKDKIKLASAQLVLSRAKLSAAKGRVYYFGDNVKTD